MSAQSMSGLQKAMNVVVTGDGDATVVFGNGFGTGRRIWDPVRRSFRGRWRFVQFDHVGTSPETQESYDPRRYARLESYADDLLALLDELGVRRCAFVGHSMSGMVSALAAIRDPERFQSLVMIGASPRYLVDEGYGGGFTEADLEALRAAMTADYDGWVGGFASAVVGNPEVPSLAQHFSSFLALMPRATTIAALPNLLRGDYRAILPEVRVPTLVLQGNGDIAVPEAVGRYLAAHLPDARFRLLDHIGHLPHLVAPAAIGRMCEEFITGVASGAR